MIKYFTTILLILLFFQTSYGQNSTLDLCEIIKYSLEQKTTDTVDYLLSERSNELSPFERSELHFIRGRLYIELFKDEIKLDKSKDILRNSLSDLNKAVELSYNENHRLQNISRRHDIMEHFNPQYQNLNSDLAILKSHGFKEDKLGLGVFAISRYDGEFWLGGELALFSAIGPTYKVKDNDGSVIAKNSLTKAASFLTVGYTRNIESELEDLTFSLIRLEAPLFIDIFKLGFVKDPLQTNWFYRPEIGIGYSFVQISLGYNFFFRKDGRDNLQKVFGAIRGKYIF